MDLKQPQPPPDVPPPPPDEQALRSKRWMWGIVLLGGSCLLLLLLLFPWPRGPDRHVFNRTAAVSNLKQVGLLLFEFDQDWGKFPGESVRLADPDHFRDSPPATDANSCLSQLITGGYTESEDIFHVRTSSSTSRPDNVISPPSRILEPGECGFSYVYGLTTSDDPDTPLLLAPMIPGTTRFDRKAFKGKAVALFLDQSVRQFDIDRSGQVSVNGKDLFDPSQPFWHGKKPDLRHPAR